jgi:hypothetical protein
MLGHWLRSWLRPFVSKSVLNESEQGWKNASDSPRILQNPVGAPVEAEKTSSLSTASVSLLGRPSASKDRPPVAGRAAWHRWLQQILAAKDTDWLVIPESCSLAKLRFCSLPANLTVKGSLDLQQCQRLRRIGTGLKVQGDLQIGGRCSEQLWYETEHIPVPLCREAQPPLHHLPSRLRIEGTLILRSCHNLTHLPADMDLKGGSTLKAATVSKHCQIRALSTEI